MKTEEISSRKIDVLVAGLLGCKVVYEAWGMPLCLCPRGLHCQKPSNLLKSYTEDIAHAMEVVEKMRGDGFSWKAWQPSTEPSTEPYNAGEPPLAVVSFVCSTGPCLKHGNPHCNHHGAYDVHEGTLPLAICKAALIALGKLPVQEQA